MATKGFPTNEVSPLAEPVPRCPQCGAVLNEKSLEITFENLRAGFIRCKYCTYKIAVQGMSGIQKSLDALRRPQDQQGPKTQS